MIGNLSKGMYEALLGTGPVTVHLVLINEEIASNKLG